MFETALPQQRGLSPSTLAGRATSRPMSPTRSPCSTTWDGSGHWFIGHAWGGHLAMHVAVAHPRAGQRPDPLLDARRRPGRRGRCAEPRTGGTADRRERANSRRSCARQVAGDGDPTSCARSMRTLWPSYSPAHGNVRPARNDPDREAAPRRGGHDDFGPRPPRGRHPGTRTPSPGRAGLADPRGWRPDAAERHDRDGGAPPWFERQHRRGAGHFPGSNAEAPSARSLLSSSRPPEGKDTADSAPGGPAARLRRTRRRRPRARPTPWRDARSARGSRAGSAFRARPRPPAGRA